MSKSPKKTRTFDRSLVDVGGDIVAGSPPPGERGWRIEVEGAAGLMLLAHEAVAQSADTEQFIEIDGVRHSHIVDPRSCLGLTSRLRVTVRAPDGVTADALSTAVSVLGAEAGRALAARYAGVSVTIEPVEAPEPRAP